MDEGLDNGLLDKDSYNEIDPLKLPPAKFYCTFKVHKEHQPPQCPPVRPIISASGSAFENIGKYTQ